MASPTYNRATGLFVGGVAVAGSLAGAAMVSTLGREGTRGLFAFLAFSALGLLWNFLTFSVNRRKGGRAAITLGPAAVLSLLPIAPPWVIAATGLVVYASDWALYRRRIVPGIFNLGQSFLCAGGALLVIRLIPRAPESLTGVGLAAVAGGLTASLVGLVLLQVALYLASGRSAIESGVLGYSAVTNELVTICFSALMATAWVIHPLTLLLPAVPFTLLFLLLGRLERREIDLSQRQGELQAIQDLGLKVSAQLETQELSQVVVRIVVEDFHARGAVLAFLDEDRKDLVVTALLDRRAVGTVSPPRVLPRQGLDDEFMNAGAPIVATPESMPRYPELGFWSVQSFIAQPLFILGKPEGVIAVFDDGNRETFAETDATRLAGLVRFIQVALNNARLFDDVRRMQQHILQSEKMTALGQLVSGVAHEINNPLATIIGSAELFENHSLPPESAPLVRRIRREAERASRIVRSLLTFSRHHKPEVGWHDLGQVIEEVAEMRGFNRKVKNISLSTDIEPGLPLVRIDPHQIQQVLVNLVGNAEQAIEETGRSGNVVLRASREAKRVRIEVADDGPGIREENLAKLFNPFFTTKPVGKGTGLGLSICYGIIQEHGGTIRAHTIPGRGACFTIDLPIPAEPPPRQQAGPASAVQAAPVSRENRGVRVLVVDDEEGVRCVLAEALQAWGFAVQEATTGEEGLSRLRHGQFDLVIMDLRMPGLDGRGLYERAAKEGVKLPAVILATGDAANLEAREFLAKVGAPLLLKPFSLTTLRETVDQALQPVEV